MNTAPRGLRLTRRKGMGCFAAMNVEELKAEAAKLLPDDRFALAGWIEQNEDREMEELNQFLNELVP